MVHFFAVPGCSNRSDRDSHLSYHRLPLKNKMIKLWIHKLGGANLTLKDSTCVCSEHFVNSRGRMLRTDEIPTLKLPVLSTRVSLPPPRRSNVDPNTGKLNKENYSKNMDLVTEAYINRVNHSPCGESHSADLSSKQHMRTYLSQYLKGSKEQKEALNRNRGNVMVPKTLLPPHEVEMWIQHLATIADNCRRGALKAADTRRRKAEIHSNKTVYFCGVCHDHYHDYTDEQELWIACDSCDVWFHFVCVGLQSEPDKLFCDNCKQ